MNLDTFLPEVFTVIPVVKEKLDNVLVVTLGNRQDKIRIIYMKIREAIKRKLKFLSSEIIKKKNIKKNQTPKSHLKHREIVRYLRATIMRSEMAAVK